jgi:hypothetical protein
MATAKQILQSTFGVKALTPSDPGIQKLAAIRTGVYPGIGPVTITPDAQVSQLLGLTPDPLAQAARAGLLDKSNTFLDKTLPALLVAGTAAVAGFGLSGVTGAVASKAIQTTPKLTGGTRMSFADGDSSGFSIDNIFGGINQALQGGLGQQLLNIGGQAATSYFTNSGPFSSPTPMLASNMAAVPAVAGAGRAVAMVGRGFFNRFPNLATGIQALRNAGNKVTRANLYSLMKRFGPDFLVTGGILTAAAVSELAMAGPGRRRMNPGNIRALRRAHRRMKSFHHVCQTNDHLLHARSRKRAPIRVGSTSITQVK